MLIYPDENQIPELYAVNDTLKSLNLEYSVIDAERGAAIATGSVKVDKNDSKKVCSLPINYSEKRLLFIEWKGDGYGFNHFITGYPTYEFAQFDEWYKLIENCASRFQKDE